MKIDLTIVADRSGSMSSIKEDAEGGINQMIRDQAADKNGSCSMTLVEFDTEYNVVFNGVDSKSVQPYKLVPRGMTALYDAVGKAINTTGGRLNNTPEPERPDKVIFMIVTDGYENSSREFHAEQIKSMIEHQKTKYSWEFVFLGADESAFEAGSKMGISGDYVAKYSQDKIKNVYKGVSNKVSFMRSGLESASMVFSCEDRKDLE